LANHFKSYMQYDQKAQLMIVAHADVRGSESYNQALTERRAELIRSYLVSQGVPSDKIQTKAVGKDQELDEARVAELQSKDPQKPEKWETRGKHTTWLAYNRRGDVILEPEGQQSTEAYPNDVAETRILWERHSPSLKAVNMASKSPASTEQARAGGAGN